MVDSEQVDVEEQSWLNAEVTPELVGFSLDEPSGPNWEVAEMIGWRQDVIVVLLSNAVKKFAQDELIPEGTSGLLVEAGVAADAED